MTDLNTDALSVPGLEHKHEWSAGGIVLGDNQGALPRYSLSAIRGIHALPDIAADSKARLSGSGEYPRPGRLLGKTVTYSGTIEAPDLGSLRYRSGLLRGAMVTGAQLAEGTMTLAPMDITNPGAQFHFNGRVAQFECDDQQAYPANAAETAFARDFVLAVRLSDPRFYLEPLVSVVSAGGTGANNPAVNATNAGSADTPHILRATGPLVNFKVAIPGYQLVILNALTGAQYVDIDFSKRTITRDNGADWGGYRDVENSNWWDAGAPGLPGGTPGPTVTAITLSQNAGNPGIGATIRSSFYSAVW